MSMHNVATTPSPALPTNRGVRSSASTASRWARATPSTFAPAAGVEGQLSPQGSGAEGAPIRFDSYGDGALPVIDMGAAYGAVIRLDNQEYWEIRHLELTASAETGDGHRQGVRVHIEGAGKVYHHIVVERLLPARHLGPAGRALRGGRLVHLDRYPARIAPR